MSRPFAVFDIDGTLIRWQLYHAIADQLVKLGYVDPSKYATIKKARANWKRRSATFKDYESELVKVYGEVLKSLNVSQFETAAQAVFNEYKDQVYTYTRDLIRSLKKDGYIIFAISGSQTEIIGMMSDYYGFDDYLGTHYDRQADEFSGKSTFYAADKAKALKLLARKHSLGFEGSIAVGDSASDASMMELVGRPIAFNPDRDLYEIAQAKGWTIVVERKNMVYKMEQENGRYILAETN